MVVRNADEALAQLSSAANGVQNNIILDADDSIETLERLRGLCKSLSKNSHKDTASIKSTQLSSSENAGSAKFTRTDCNTIDISVEASTRSILLIAENYYPGWFASIEQDGKSSNAEIMHGDYLFQAVEVPPGKSKVHLRFAPKGYSTGLIILLITTIIAILIIVFEFKNLKALLAKREDRGSPER